MVSHYSFTFWNVVAAILFSLKFFIASIENDRKMIRNADDIVDSLRIYVIRLNEKPRITAEYACVCVCGLRVDCRMSDAAAQKNQIRTKQSKTRELMIKTHVNWMLNSGVNMLNPMEKVIQWALWNDTRCHRCCFIHTFFVQKEPSTMRLMCITCIICVSLHVFMHLNISDSRDVSPEKWHNTADLLTAIHDNYHRRHRKKRNELFKIEESVMNHSPVLCCMCNRQFVHFRECHLAQHQSIINTAIACHSIMISFPNYHRR